MKVQIAKANEKSGKWEIPLDHPTANHNSQIVLVLEEEEKTEWEEVYTEIEERRV